MFYYNQYVRAPALILLPKRICSATYPANLSILALLSEFSVKAAFRLSLHLLNHRVCPPHPTQALPYMVMLR